MAARPAPVLPHMLLTLTTSQLQTHLHKPYNRGLRRRYCRWLERAQTASLVEFPSMSFTTLGIINTSRNFAECVRGCSDHDAATNENIYDTLELDL